MTGHDRQDTLFGPQQAGLFDDPAPTPAPSADDLPIPGLFVQSRTGTLHASERCGVTRRVHCLNIPVERTRAEMRAAMSQGRFANCARCGGMATAILRADGSTK